MVIGGTQERAAQPTSCNIREISFYGIGFYNIDLVKIALGKSECVSLQEFRVYGDFAVFAKLNKRCFGLRRETNFISSGFFQKQAGQNKQRIGNGAGLDLGDHIFKYVLTRQKTNGSFEWL